MLGNTNVKIKFLNRITEFDESIAPTVWADTVALTECSATNDYGEWKIQVSQKYTQTPSYAFDNDTTTYWLSTYLDKVDECWIDLILPQSIAICPKNLYVDCQHIGDDSLVQGLNILTGEWDNFKSFSASSGSSHLKFDVSVATDRYYSKFRFKSHGYGSSSYAHVYLYEFKITSGMIKYLTN